MIKKIDTKTSRKETNDVKNNMEVEQKDANLLPAELSATLKFTTTMTELKNKIETEITALKNLRTEVRKLESNYQQDLNKVWRTKKKRMGNREKTGFVKNKKLPEQLATLIGVDSGTEMSMPEYTKKFYQKVLKDKNLLYENDKRVFRASPELLQLFEMPESVNNSTDYRDINGFNFSTLQKHLSKLMKTVPDAQEVEEKVEDKVEAKEEAKVAVKIVSKKGSKQVKSVLNSA